MGSGTLGKGVSAGEFQEFLLDRNCLRGPIRHQQNLVLLSCHAVNVLSVLTCLGQMHFFWKLVLFLEN